MITYKKIGKQICLYVNLGLIKFSLISLTLKKVDMRINITWGWDN